MFVPALLALLPGQLRWMHVIPVEGLLGRVVGDVLIHYLNLVGAYIVCATMVAVALYLSRHSHSRRFSYGLRHTSRLSRLCGIATRLAGGPAQEKAAERNSISGGSRSRW